MYVCHIFLRIVYFKCTILLLGILITLNIKISGELELLLGSTFFSRTRANVSVILCLACWPIPEKDAEIGSGVHPVLSNFCAFTTARNHSSPIPSV